MLIKKLHCVSIVLLLAFIFIPLSFVGAENTFSNLLKRASGQYLSTPDSEALDLGGPLTIEAWVKINSPIPSGSNFGIVTKGTDTNLDLSYAFRLRDTGGGQNELDFAYWKDTGFTERNWDVNIQPGIWTHVSAVVIPATRDIKLYVNGEENEGVADGSAVSIHDSNGNLYVGNDAWGSGRYMDGHIDDVRIWNVARTEAEIVADMNRELVGDEVGLVGYWKLNGSFEDATVNGNHLTPVNGPQFSTDTPFTDAEETIDPVIVVPGILGSAQRHDVWIIDPILHTYDDLIATLDENGYTLGEDLFTFGYDWRNSNVATAELLKQRIDEVKGICACSKVDLVAHSMGGLVARQYVQSGEYENDVDQLIFLGTPHRGAPKAYLMWEGGAFVTPSVFDFLTQRFLKGDAKKAGFASVFEYLHEHPVAAVSELLPDESYLFDDGNPRAYPSAYPTNPFLESLNADLQALLGAGSTLYSFVSNGHSTITGLNVVPAPEKAPLWEHGYPENLDTTLVFDGLILGDGDQTVPFTSASFVNQNLAVLDAKHGALPEESAGEIVEILRGEPATTVVDNWNVPDIKVLMFQMFSPANLLITDPAGKRIGTTANGEDINEISGAFYTGPEAEREVITIPNPIAGTYTMSVHGTGEGSYEVRASYLTEGEADDLSRVGATTAGALTEHTIVLDENGSDELRAEVTIERMLENLSFAYAEGWVAKGVYTSILAKLKTAQKMWSSIARDAVLQNIEKEIESQRGKGINDAAYEILSEDIDALLR